MAIMMLYQRALHAGKFSFFFHCLLIVFKIRFFINFFQEYHHFVRPDLGPNCLQKISADDRSCHWLAKSLNE